MGIERIEDEEAVFNMALAIEAADERSAYLHRACGGDILLLNRVQALLEVQATKISFLEQAATSLQLTLDARAVTEGLGPVLAAIHYSRRSAKAAWRSCTWRSRSNPSAARWP